MQQLVLKTLVVTHKASGRKKEFENFEAFDDFLLNDIKGKNFEVNDFVVPIIGFALSNVKSKVDSIVGFDWVNDYKLYIQGKVILDMMSTLNTNLIVVLNQLYINIVSTIW